MLRAHPSWLALIVVFAILVPLGCKSPVQSKLTWVPGGGPASQDALIQELALSYHERNLEVFSRFFAPDSAGMPYTFFLDPNSIQPGDPTNWGLSEELRIARRMFRPDSVVAGENPVPSDLWLVNIDIALTRTSADWAERFDLYRSDTNPGGLDPLRWKATDAQYHCELFFKTQGNTDYRVDGKSNFVVVEDLTKDAGAPGKFAIVRWEDLGPYSLKSARWLGTAGVEPATWGMLKRLYR